MTTTNRNGKESRQSYIQANQGSDKKPPGALPAGYTTSPRWDERKRFNGYRAVSGFLWMNSSL